MKPFELLLSELIDKMGQGTLADKIGIDQSLLSRFRSGQGAITLSVIEKIMVIADALVISRGEVRRLEDAFEVATDLWKKARKGNGNGKTRLSD